MNIKLPPPPFYDIWELCDHWGLRNDGADLICKYVQTGKLQMVYKCRNTIDYLNWEPIIPTMIEAVDDLYGETDYFFLRTEVERFEREECQQLTTTIASKAAEQSAQETDKQLCERLKKESLTKKEISRELKRVFPALTDFRIGKLVTEITGISVTADAYRKRGKRLLE